MPWFLISLKNHSQSRWKSFQAPLVSGSFINSANLHTSPKKDPFHIVCVLLHFKPLTCFPVNPWQITRVFLSTQTLAVDDICLLEEENTLCWMAWIIDFWALVDIIVVSLYCFVFVFQLVLRSCHDGGWIDDGWANESISGGSTGWLFLSFFRLIWRLQPLVETYCVLRR